MVTRRLPYLLPPPPDSHPLRGNLCPAASFLGGAQQSARTSGALLAEAQQLGTKRSFPRRRQQPDQR